MPEELPASIRPQLCGPSSTRPPRNPLSTLGLWATPLATHNARPHNTTPPSPVRTALTSRAREEWLQGSEQEAPREPGTLQNSR